MKLAALAAAAIVATTSVQACDHRLFFRLEIVRDRTAKLEQRRSRLGCSSHVD